MQQMSSESPDFRLEDFLPYRLSVAANRVSRRFADRYGAAFGLSIPEWRVMAVLGRFGRLPGREIAACTAMDKVKVSRAVQGLAACECPFQHRNGRIHVALRERGAGQVAQHYERVGA